MRWSGEWEITYETFRDMGIAYSMGLLLIYLLVVGQFKSYLVPLVIMAPIPLTVIGVMPGHWLFGAQFTATSMIGMIALAGIIVRNSILLVDFINHSLAAGLSLEDAVVEAGAVRAKPIILTALAAMLGAFFILSDPIFQGLAVSLVFGVLVSHRADPAGDSIAVLRLAVAWRWPAPPGRCAALNHAPAGQSICLPIWRAVTHAPFGSASHLRQPSDLARRHPDVGIADCPGQRLSARR